MEMNTQANAMPTKHSSAYGDNFKHLFEGVHFRFPKFQHTHPAVINVNEVADDQLTMGQRVADRVATGMGVGGLLSFNQSSSLSGLLAMSGCSHIHSIPIR